VLEKRTENSVTWKGVKAPFALHREEGFGRRGGQEEVKMKKMLIVAAVLVLLTTIFAAAACGGGKNAAADQSVAAADAPGSSAQAGSLGEKLGNYLREAEKEWGFQGSVLVARGGRVILETGLGEADRARNIPDTPDTKFLLASVGKVFTATAVMKLAEEGTLRLEDSVLKYLPGFKDCLAPDITLAHILSHSSGLPEALPAGTGPEAMSKPVEPRALAAGIRGQKPLFAPGAEVRYSNVGYVLLGLVIERVTGESYYDWVGTHILKPLGMDNSGTDMGYASAPGFARGYVEDREGTLRPAPPIHLSWAYSAGAQHSTVGDLYKFDRALSGTKLLSAASLEAMFRPRNDSFCLGWLVDTAFGRPSRAHGGGAPGFSTWIERWPDDDAFVAVLSNVTRAPAAEIGRSLAAILFGEPHERPLRRTAVSLPAAPLAEYAGGYRTAKGDIRQVILEGNNLFVVRGSGPRHPILPFARDGFFFPGDKGAFLRFVRDAEGRVTGQVFHQLGVDESAPKITP
jgi:CubicO group peptidase (beta-lactamase class C family)